MSDDLYRERAHLLALLVTGMMPAVISHSDPAEPDWAVLSFNGPVGQLSWHISPTDLELFPHVSYVPPDHPSAVWDGHSTEMKLGRIKAMVDDYLRHYGIRPFYRWPPEKVPRPRS